MYELNTFLKRKLKICLLLAAGVLLSVSVYAQQITVTGTVIDNNDETMPGVSVTIKGTARGTATDINGKFTITVPDAEAVLQFSFVGYSTQEIMVGDQRIINVTLEETAAMLEEAVVLGYLPSIRKDQTASISSVGEKALGLTPVSSAGEAMVGKLAGVQVTTADGSPGAELNIRIRGGTSVTQSNQPLFIVDGFPVANINDLPPTEIHSIDVLKDASLTAIYGARGSNGVVIVTTKSAKSGKVTVSANHYTQLRKLTKRIPVLDAYEFVRYYDDIASRGSGDRNFFRNAFGHPYDIDLYKRFGQGNDWQADILGATPITTHYNISVGGGDQLKFNVSLTHIDERGILVGSGMAKTNLMTKFTGNISPRIKFEFNPRVYYSKRDGDGTTGVNILDALRLRPTDGLRQFGFIPADVLDPEAERDFIYVKPTEQSEQNYRLERQWAVTIQGAVTVDIGYGFTFRSAGNFTYANSYTDRFWGTKTGTARNNKGQPLATKSSREDNSYTWTNTLIYNKRVAEVHRITLLAGQEVNHSESKAASNRSRYFPVDITGKVAMANFALGTPWDSSSSYATPNRLVSFFGQANYNYNGKYLVSGTFRADASTLFAPENRWGYFPAASAGWVISEEDFMRGQSLLSYAKFRVAIGITGNNRINADSWRYLFSVKTDLPPGFGEPTELPYYYGNADGNGYLPNKNVKWETTISRNVALDLQFMNNRLSVTPELYWNTTKDLLYRVEVPLTSGYQYQMQNIAQTTNRGVELDVKYNIISNRDFLLDFNFNIGANKRKIDKLAGGETEFYMRSDWQGNSGPSEYDYVMKVGGDLGLIYGYVNDGFYNFDGFAFETGNWIVKDPGLVDCSAMFGFEPGAIKYKNLANYYGGADDDVNKVNEGDMTVIGKTTPDFSGGFGFSGAYKGFDFNVFFNYIYGFDVNNVNKFRLSSWTSNSIRTLNNLSTDFTEDRCWRYANHLGEKLHDSLGAVEEYMALNANAKTYNPWRINRAVSQSDNIEDGSFLRLQNITVGYTLPKQLTQKISISSLRVYFTGYNLLTWTNYSGYDPEVRVQYGLTPGIDSNVYPRTRNYTFGINVTF